jgi:hypothetical protein
MRQSQQALVTALRRVQRFLETNAAELPGVSATRARTDLDDTLAQLERLAVDQLLYAKEAEGYTAEKHRLRRVLRQHHMRPIAIIAQLSLKTDAQIAMLKVPDRDVKDATLMGRAYDMATLTEFIRDNCAGTLPDDFDQRLRNAAEDVRIAAWERDMAQAFAIHTTKLIDEEVRRARGIVNILDALVSVEAHDNLALVAGWQSAKHVRAKPGVPRGTVRAKPADAEENAA